MTIRNRGFTTNGLAYDPENGPCTGGVNGEGELYSFDPANGFQHTFTC